MRRMIHTNLALYCLFLVHASGVSAAPLRGTASPNSWIIASSFSRPMRVAVRSDAKGVFALPIDTRTAWSISAGPGWNVQTVIDSLPAGATSLPEIQPASPEAAIPRLHSSSSWLGLLPNGEEKRRFILDCTGCHQFNETRVFAEGKLRDGKKWTEDTARMLTYAGSTTGFPVISDYRKPEPTAAWLMKHLAPMADGGAPVPPGPVTMFRSVITEYDMPVAGDLPHDVAIDRSGQVIITGMMTSAMYTLDPETGTMAKIEIPVQRANPRAVELDRSGNWWVLLGAPKQIGRYEPAGGKWSFFPIEMYPHSIAISEEGGSAWYNGHFTRDPELIGRLDVATGKVETFSIPKHPTLGDIPGGPVPYEQRLGPDGTIWMSELQGNRIISFDPETHAFKSWELPTPWSGPRRFDVDHNGILWIPAYSAGLLVRLDPRTGKFTEFPIPIPDAVPYIARADPASGAIWIGTAASDYLFRFDPASNTFSGAPLPTRGATVRHMVIDPRSGDVWLAYGASPALHPARIARVQPG